MDSLPFVAREHELGLLQQRLIRSLQGQGQVALIKGEAGTGKTALINHFARIGQLIDPRLLTAIGVCSAQSGVSDPYLPYREILAMLTGDTRRGLTEKEAASENGKRLQAFLRFSGKAVVEFAPDLVGLIIPGASLIAKMGVFVAEEVGWVEKLEKLGRQETDEAELDQDRIFEQITILLQVLSDEQPLMLVFDDLHWADKASLALFFHLTRQLEKSRILLVGAARPEEIALGRNGERHPLDKIVSEIKRYSGGTEVDLDKAMRDRGGVFVSDLVHSHYVGLGGDFEKSLHQHTGGHPLFTVELLRALEERGDIERQDGEWFEQGDIVWNDLPSRVEGVLEERIGRLPDELREILSTGSVEGEEFTGQVIAHLEKLDERQLLKSLSQQLAKRHRLVYEQGEIRIGKNILSSYKFSSAALQRYLYGNLSRGERRILHQEIGEFLEVVYEGQLEAIAVILAWHFAEADQAGKAARYLLQAGDRARLLFAYQDAAECYEQALAYLRDASDYERMARTLMKLGLTYHMAGDYNQAREAYQEGFVLWSYLEDTPSEYPESEQPLRVDYPYPPMSLDPALAADVDSSGVVDQLFAGLVSLSAELEVIPDVAHSWEVHAEGKEYVFHLRDDVIWSDGERLTAHDFVYAWRRVLDPETRSPAAALLYDVKGAKEYHQGTVHDPSNVGVHAQDESTLIVELEEPTSYFLYLLTYNVCYAVPRHHVEEKGAEWTSIDAIVTSGPFILEEWDEEKLSLKRNEGYHGRTYGNVKAVELVSIPEGSDRLKAYEDGELDIFYLMGLGPKRERVRRKHASEYISAPTLMTTLIGLNVNLPPFDDWRVRQAIAQAFDKRLLADVRAGGYVFPANGGLVPPGMAGHNADIGLPFEPAAARKLLTESGYPKGKGFPETILLVEQSNEFPMQFLAAEWKRNLGIAVELEICDFDTFFQRLETDPPAGYPFTWMVDYPDPDNFLRVCDAVRWTSWQDDGYDELVHSARVLQDQRQRLDLYRKAEELLIQGAAVIPLTYGRSHMLVSHRIKNLPMSALRWWHWKDAVIEPY